MDLRERIAERIGELEQEIAAKQLMVRELASLIDGEEPVESEEEEEAEEEEEEPAGKPAAPSRDGLHRNGAHPNGASGAAKKPPVNLGGRGETKVKIARLLADGPKTTGEIAATFGMTTPGVGFHLKGSPWFAQQDPTDRYSPWELTEEGKAALAQSFPGSADTA